MISYLMVKRMDIGLAVIVVSLLSISIIHGQSVGLDVDGWISIDSPGLVYSTGDNVTFTFNATFNLTNDHDVLNISIWSPTLQFLDATAQWILLGLHSDPDIGSQPRFDPTSDVVVEEGIDDDNDYNLYFNNINNNTWSFSGNFQMTVRDDVGHGRRIQAMMTIAVPTLDGNWTISDTLPSQYGYTQSLCAELVPPPSPAIGIRDTAYINVSLFLSENNTAPMVEIMSPFENTSREVMLTINGVTINDTYGLESDVVEEIGQIKPLVKSTFSTYQRDISIIQLPLLRNIMGANESGLGVRVLFRLEDYAVMEDGDNLTIGAGIKFGDGMIWVSHTTLKVDAPDASNRKPDLVLHHSVSSVCSGEDRNDVSLNLYISHGKNSTATGYDLQINLFPLPSMTLLSSYAASPEDFYFIINISKYFRITLGRLTFSDPATLSLKMRVQMNDTRLRDVTSFTVPIELVYNDRWNNSQDKYTAMEYMTVRLNKKCAERYTWSTGSTCTCTFNTSRSDCGCCIQHETFNITQCGEQNPAACAPVDRPWLCWNQMDGFLSQRKMFGFSGELFECDASQKYSRQRNSEPSCYKKSSGGYREVHPLVSVILGKDSATNSLYGVSSTGKAYVSSNDGGQSWFTIRDSVFQTASSAPSYSSASFY